MRGITPFGGEKIGIAYDDGDKEKDPNRTLPLQRTSLKSLPSSNLAIRWFSGYGLQAKLPDHSSLTRIRKRWGADLFRRIFQRSVQACVAAGIAKGEVVHIDASLIRADVSWESLTAERSQQTGEISKHDAKGRRTTTAQSLHPLLGGGWIIDTPGMRSLHLSDAVSGLDELFAEITDLAPQCRFRDCTHDHEPGCAVQAAVRAGTLPDERVARWRVLNAENISNTPQQLGPRRNKIAQRKR